MGCLTRASQYELALYARSVGKLLINPYYTKGPAKTLTWQKKNDWYATHKTNKFWTKRFWDLMDPYESFVIKSLESRFNFVYAVQTHGTDLMINDTEFYRSIEGMPFSHSFLETKYDIYQFDSDYLQYVKSSDKPRPKEPVLINYLI